MDFRGAEMQAAEAADRIADKDAELMWLRSSLASLLALAESDSAMFTRANVAEVARRALEKKASALLD